MVAILDQIEDRLAHLYSLMPEDSGLKRRSSVSVEGEDSETRRNNFGQHILGRTEKWGSAMKIVEVFLDGAVLLADALMSSENKLSRGFTRLHEDISLTRRIWLPPYRLALGLRILYGEGKGPKDNEFFKRLDLYCGSTLLIVNSLAIACLFDKRGYLHFSYLGLPAKPIHRLLDYASVGSSALSAVNAHARCAYLKSFLNDCRESDSESFKETIQSAVHEEFFSGMRYWFQMVANLSKIAGFKGLRQGMRISAALCTLAQFYWEPECSLNFSPLESQN